MFDKWLEESHTIRANLVGALRSFSKKNPQVKNKLFLLEAFLDYFDIDKSILPEAYIKSVNKKKDLQALIESSIIALLDRTKNLDSTSATVFSSLIKAMVTLNQKTNKQADTTNPVYKDVLDLIPRDHLIAYLKLEDF